MDINTKISLHRVKRTWRGYFDEEKLLAIEDSLNTVDKAGTNDDYNQPKVYVNPKFIKPDKDQVFVLKLLCIDWISHLNSQC